MLGIFCTTGFSNNEEYKIYLKKMNRIMTVLFVIGVITLVTGLAALHIWNVAISEGTLYYYMGVGAGLMLGSAVVWMKNVRKMKDEKSLKKNRIEAADERNVQNRNAAVKAALIVLLIGMYLAMLIGALWYPVLKDILLFLVTLFIFSYVVAYRVISRKS